ncbi:nucleotide pyrophosphohydrolase [Fervidibacillus halotolerans]|uniref:Nucleotide pyrophosphohydrolase n=1 Tax=Fervidibacillus halotolerans TaxID=2980027 RepID=A0A9E8LZX4_9BACI|nr:nucleotide pyrophosphohydrolase [Fervidibacillus halotolerans]WAA12664.1 nucleotide pyrophosphohydrolase [Fervidibacillus halotolerans]
MHDNNIKVQEIKDRVKTFVEQRNWQEAHNPKNLAMSIAIESAELMEIFQWLSIQESWEVKNSEQFTHLKEELADVLIYCLSLSNRLDIDVTTIIEEKLKKNEKKYPVNEKND